MRSKPTIRNIDELMAAFGGTSAFAREIGVRPQHATMMNKRGSIPIAYWPRLIKAGKTRRIDAEFLLKLHVRDGQ